jgi:hypothetical protein
MKGVGGQGSEVGGKQRTISRPTPDPDPDISHEA